MRAGPPEGYGPGTWFYEPSGARHDATQRVSDDDLIYTANVYGPLTFDTGPGTPIVAVVSWMDYVALAEAGGINLVPNTFTLMTVACWPGRRLARKTSLGAGQCPPSYSFG